MKMHTKKLTTIASSMLIAMSATAAEDKALETIEVKGSYIQGYGAHDASGASRLELAIVDIPQSVSVITDTQMNDYQLKDINAVLDTATGVNVERIETDRTYYTARGFDITNFQIDGVGLPLTSGNNHADEDTAIYDRIEIIRGANGLMTGVGNPSATVNFIRKRPNGKNAFSAAATVGSWDNARLELDATAKLNDAFAVRTVAVKQSKESYLDRYEQDKNIFYLFANYNINEATTFSISHAINDNNATGNNWGANPLFYTDGSATNYDVSANTSADWSFWDIKKQNTVLEASHVFANSWQLRATYSHKTTDEDTELFYVYGTPDKTTELGLLGYASEYDHDEDSDLVDVYLNGHFALFGREHEFVVGASHSEMEYQDHSLYDYTTGNGFPALPAFNTWDGNTPRPTFADGATGADVERTQKAIYFTTRFSVNDNFHLIAGGRQNDWQVEGSSYGVAQDASDDEFIPYLGGVYKVLPSLSAYASYTETFLSQTELDINNKTLAPITGESKEVGLKAQLFDDKFIATFAYFDVVQENLATPDPATANLAPTEQRYIGSTGIESSGFEFDLAGELLPGLHTSIGFTDFDIDGNELVKNYTPERLFKLAATYDFSQIDGLSLGVNMRWQDDISRIQGVVPSGLGFSNEGQDIVTRQEAYSIVNLMARYRINDEVALALNANNVTDEKYINSLYWAQGFYGAPSNYSLTLTWSL
jgi:outer membrane receptor for ferric coprogen and ferric-rhodotorulic acid